MQESGSWGVPMGTPYSPHTLDGWLGAGKHRTFLPFSSYMVRALKVLCSFLTIFIVRVSFIACMPFLPISHALCHCLCIFLSLHHSSDSTMSSYFFNELENRKKKYVNFTSQNYKCTRRQCRIVTVFIFRSGSS